MEKEEKKHFDGKYAQRFTISPDNNWVAWSELFKVYVAPMPVTGQSVGLTSSTKAVPVAQVGKDAGINIHFFKKIAKNYFGPWVMNILRMN